MLENTYLRQVALNNFQQARQRAKREQIAARLAGRDSNLLPFEAIRAQLKQRNPMYQGIDLIPLANITGSVGRYAEFTRHFLPLNDSFRERWVSIEALAVTQGWSPVEVYKIGNVYFVKDGNHRVAVARQMGLRNVEAHVWAFPADIALGPEDDLDTALIRLGELRFMQQTQLDQTRPDHGIYFTTPARYTELLAQIEDLRETLCVIDGYCVSYEDAVPAWYDIVYLPTVQIIQDAGLLEQFPGRTEADLFVWLSVHRNQLGDLYGSYSGLMELAEALVVAYAEGGLGRLARQLKRFLGQQSKAPLMVPESIEEAILLNQEEDQT